MPLFPESFLADLRLQADIVQVVQEVVSLRRVGGRYVGLCPFHNEKSPSFGVDREKGVFHCFGCGVGGNVFKFVELHERLSFPEAVRALARKFGVAIPEGSDTGYDPSADAERESLITLHEVAAKFYRDVLASDAGRRGRELLDRRGLDPQIVESLGFGFAPPGRDALQYTCSGLYAALEREADGGFDPATHTCSSLAVLYRFDAVPAFVAK